MKEQKIYHVTVVQKTEDLHEASGIIQGITRAVMFDGKIPAVTEESAKQKALAQSGVTDFDSVEVKVEAINFRSE